jgi:prepilin-type N-terminal cleavage/methylation domain-containing protein
MIKSKESGFTLLEILVVLTIMGFLIAMVAPRLAGISNDASETVCDSNKGRIKTYVSSFYEKFNRYPNKLTNLVMTDGATLADANAAEVGYQVAYCSDDNPDNGPEVIHSGHNKAYKFMIHRLSEDEANELKSLGITRIFNLNDYASEADGLDGAAAFARQHTPADSTDMRVSNWADITAVTEKRPFMEPCNIKAGVGVIMCGCGINLAGDSLTYIQGERGWAEEDLFGRITFAVGPESELVTTGIVSNAAHCPGSIQNADNFTSGHYYLILPRLASTVERLADSGVTYSPLWGSGTLTYATLETITAVSWDKRNGAPGADYNFGTDPSNLNLKTRTGLDLHKAMDSWDFDTNRQRYDEVWGLDLNGNDILNGG